jgi:hypothetical protein
LKYANGMFFLFETATSTEKEFEIEKTENFALKDSRENSFKV